MKTKTFDFLLENSIIVINKSKKMLTAQPKSTLGQYDEQWEKAFQVLLQTPSHATGGWRRMTNKSIARYINEKALKIRNLQEHADGPIDGFIQELFAGIANFSIVALIEINPANENVPIRPTAEVIENLYQNEVKNVRDLMLKKNHDYGEAWRDMRQCSFIDLILSKLVRIHEIEENHGETLVSEGIDANYADIANYAIFALIKISEGETS